MMQIAQLIKAGVGLEIAFTDTGNDVRWDTHVNEGGSRGQLANFFAALARRSPHSRPISANKWTTSW